MAVHSFLSSSLFLACLAVCLSLCCLAYAETKESSCLCAQPLADTSPLLSSSLGFYPLLSSSLGFYPACTVSVASRFQTYFLWVFTCRFCILIHFFFLYLSVSYCVIFFCMHLLIRSFSPSRYLDAQSVYMHLLLLLFTSCVVSDSLFFCLSALYSAISLCAFTIFSSHFSCDSAPSICSIFPSVSFFRQFFVSIRSNS